MVPEPESPIYYPDAISPGYHPIPATTHHKYDQSSSSAVSSLHQQSNYENSGYQQSNYGNTLHQQAPYDSTLNQQAPYDSTLYQQAPYDSTLYQQAPFDNTLHQQAHYDNTVHQQSHYDNTHHQESNYGSTAGIHQSLQTVFDLAKPTAEEECRYWCPNAYNEVYCCESKYEAELPVGVKSGFCPAVRSQCPQVQGRHRGPKKCSNDYSCSGSDKCCYDTCLSRHICKPVRGSLIDIIARNN